VKGTAPVDTALKIAVSGKGGVGKTTVAALLCRTLVERGLSVIALDADPDANLAAAIGIRDDNSIVPLASMQELIRERTGAPSGSVGSFFKINPHVADLPEKLWQEHNGIRLLKMGTVKQGGSGCICPASAVVKAMMQHLVLYRNEAVIMDMEAGIEHLGRATAQAVQHLIVVVEPGLRSLETAQAIRALARDLGLERVCLIANKIRTPSDVDFITEHADGLDILAMLPFDDNFMQADRQRLPAWELCPAAVRIMRAACARLAPPDAA
jgi:CO dehydrogenase maturation factor